ncbi:PAS domain-containing sensor histidine kinase [archaeon]|nr:PAS domain-containing sensor histidine kinase [archaeon]
MILGTRLKIPFVIALAGAVIGYFILSPFAMYMSHSVHLVMPAHEMGISDVFAIELFLWALPFTLFGGAIGLIIGLLYQRVKDRTEGIKKEKEYTEQVVDSMNEGMLVVDRDFKIISANRAFLETFGYSMNEVRGKHCFEVSHGVSKPCNTEDHICPLKEVFAKGEAYSTIHTHKDKEGSEVFIEITASPVKDENGEVIHIIELIRDVTIRKQANDLIRESEGRYRNLAENALVGIYKTNLEGKILYANKALSDMLGFGSPGELTSKSVLPIYKNPRDRDTLIKELEKTGGVDNYEIELVTKTGEVKKVLLSTTFDGDVLSGMMMDITKRRQAQEALRLSEERLSSIAESTEDIIIMQDLEGRYLYYNAPPIYGITVDEVVGKTPSDLLKPEKAAGLMERINEIARSGKSLSGEEESTLGGMCLWFHFQMSPIKDSAGRVTAVTTVLRNITDYKWAEMALKKYVKDLEEANKMKDLFTDIMTHDLLGPAGVIRNAAELLMDDARESQKELLQVIKWGGEKQEEIIGLTGKLSKLESAEDIEKNPVDLRNIIDKVVIGIRLLLEEADMTVENRIGEGRVVNANPVIEEVFLNLLTNARRYAEDGKKVIIESIEGPESHIVMVKDFGPGIPDENKQGIFERFSRNAKESVKGTGLGLAIAKRVVEIHDGKIWVEDNPEGGAVFKVSLPK